MSGGRALKASTTTTKGKENVAPVGMTKEDGQVDTRKRKQAPTAAANGAAKKGKAKAVDVDEDDALDDKEELRAALAASRASFKALQAQFDDLSNQRHTTAEAKSLEIMDLHEKLDATLNDALKTAKQEAKELKLQLAQVQDQTVAPIPRAASPPIAASQPKGKGKQAEASAAAIAEAYERGVREGNQRVADLEAEVSEVQTRFSQAQRALARAKANPVGDEGTSDWLELLSDMSGFTILDGNTSPTDPGAKRAYKCIVSDLKGTGLTLQFRMTLWEDSSWTYTPQLQHADERLLDALDGKFATFRDFMRFDQKQLSSFARRLLVCINGFSR